MSLVDSTSPATFHWATTSLNEMLAPQSFLRTLLGGAEEVISVEDIEYGIETRARIAAPFTKTFAEGLMVGGWSTSTRLLRAPNIRIKSPFTPAKSFLRRPGDVVFVNGGGGGNSQAESVLRARTKDLMILETDIQNTEEYMVSQFLQGGLTYNVASQDSFAFALGRAAGNSITPSTFMDQYDPGTTDYDLTATLHAVKRVAANAYSAGVTITDAICGTSAADAFNRYARLGGIPGLLYANNATNPFLVGSVDFTSQFNNEGVIFLGRVSGINFWEYGRTISVNGASTDLIRSKYIEFVSRDNAASGRSMVYAPIPDVQAGGVTGLVIAKRFGKTWYTEDPSAEMVLAASRPMPMWKRPNTTISYKAVSG